jgi:hypothetical protein
VDDPARRARPPRHGRRRRSSRSGWAWPRPSARRSPARTGCRSRRSATAGRCWCTPRSRRTAGRGGWRRPSAATDARHGPPVRGGARQIPTPVGPRRYHRRRTSGRGGAAASHRKQRS